MSHHPHCMCCKENEQVRLQDVVLGLPAWTPAHARLGRLCTPCPTPSFWNLTAWWTLACDRCPCAQTAELMRRLRDIVTLVHARYVQRHPPTCERADAPQGPAQRKRKRASGGEPPACQ